MAALKVTLHLTSDAAKSLAASRLNQILSVIAPLSSINPAGTRVHELRRALSAAVSSCASLVGIADGASRPLATRPFGAPPTHKILKLRYRRCHMLHS